MNKPLYQGLLLLSMFFIAWLGFKQINWMRLLNVEEVSEKSEDKIGELFWNIYSDKHYETNNEFVINAIDSIYQKICLANNISTNEMQLHIITSDEINAFAMPGGHLVLNTALIKSCDNPEELSGVIAHELAHIQLNHIRNKLIKEFGLTVLINIGAGGAGTEIINEALKTLSSSAFDRNLEKEADLKALDYMTTANINPENLANFLYKLSDTDDESSSYLSWLSTHPELKERAKYILEYSTLSVFNDTIISTSTWKNLQAELY